jgi:diadenosine tetraphosphate (Ap4A) HIT family hydrolase
MTQPHPVARVQAAISGPTADTIAVTQHSVLLLGEHQFYPGYCVLWSRDPVKELHHLNPAAYLGYLVDLRRACSAVDAAYQPWKINLAALGNQVQHLHTHIFPRQADDAQRSAHPWVHEPQFKPADAAAQAEAVKRLTAAWNEARP